MSFPLAGWMGLWATWSSKGWPCSFEHKTHTVFFTVNVVRHWNRLPREIPLLEISKTQLDTALRILLQLTLHWVGWLDQRSIVPYKPQLFHDAVSLQTKQTSTAKRPLSIRAHYFANSGDSPASNHLNSRTHVTLSRGRPIGLELLCYNAEILALLKVP